MSTHPSKYLSSMRTFYRGMLLAQLVFFFFAFGMVQIDLGYSPEVELDELAVVLRVLVPSVGVCLLLIAQWSYRQRLKGIKRLQSLRLKLQRLQMAFVFRTALHLGLALFIVFVYLFTGGYYYLALYLVFLLWFISQRVEARKVARELELTEEQTQQIMPLEG